jgi:hypothetical protein
MYELFHRGASVDGDDETGNVQLPGITRFGRPKIFLARRLSVSSPSRSPGLLILND